MGQYDLLFEPQSTFIRTGWFSQVVTPMAKRPIIFSTQPFLEV